MLTSIIALVAMVLMLRPRSGAAQWVVDQRFEIDPPQAATEFTDTHENLC